MNRRDLTTITDQSIREHMDFIVIESLSAAKRMVTTDPEALDRLETILRRYTMRETFEAGRKVGKHVKARETALRARTPAHPPEGQPEDGGPTP